jgi:hypothetical protein
MREAKVKRVVDYDGDLIGEIVSVYGCTSARRTDTHTWS